MRERIEFIGFDPRRDAPARPTRAPRSSASPSRRRPRSSPTRAPTSSSTWCCRRTSGSGTGRAGDTLEFFQARGRAAGRASSSASPSAIADVQDRERRRAARQPGLPPRPAAARAGAAARRSSARRRRCGTSAPPWSGSSSAPAALDAMVELTPEEEELEALKSQLIQQQRDLRRDQPARSGCSRPASRRSRGWSTSSARRARCPTPSGEPAEPLSELDIELAPIDARLEFIAEEKARIEATLAELDASIQATPANEMVLGGLERELDDPAGAVQRRGGQPRPGPGRRAHRGDVQGRALLADRAADRAEPARQPEPRC